MNRDFSDLLRAFSNAGVEYLVVGAHALGVHDRARATKDLDVWIRPTAENARRVWQALATFGAPLSALRVEDLEDETTVLQIGVAPIRIDVITSIENVSFDEAWPNRVEVDREGVNVWIIGLKELIRNKEAVGRPQDLVDAARLRKRLLSSDP